MVIIWLMMVNNNLIGGWPTPLKNMTKSMGRIIPYIIPYIMDNNKCSKPPTSQDLFEKIKLVNYYNVT
jgi:hypothetical protein